MDTIMLLKTMAILFAIVGGIWSLLAGRMADAGSPDPDARRRRHYLCAYGATSLSILFLAATAMV